MARDKIHDGVKQALVNDGWTILKDPFRIKFEGKVVAADLRAERLIHLTRDSERIVVEIKSFIGRSFIKDLQGALGQNKRMTFISPFRPQLMKKSSQVVPFKSCSIIFRYVCSLLTLQNRRLRNG